MPALRHQVVRVLTMSVFIFSLVVFHGYFIRKYHPRQLVEVFCEIIADPLGLHLQKNGAEVLYKSKMMDLADASSVEYVYTPPRASSSGGGSVGGLAGKPLRASIEVLRLLDMPPSRFVKVTPEAEAVLAPAAPLDPGGPAPADPGDSTTVVSKPVFVLGLTDRTYGLGLQTIASVQALRRAHKILVYDLGLRPHQVAELQELCMVLYRVFDFQLFPAHVSEVSNMAWKPLLLQSCLAEYGVVFYLEPGAILGQGSTRHWQRILSQALTSGVLMFQQTGLDLLHATHSQMFEYLPVGAGLDTALRTPVLWSGAVALVNTAGVYSQVTKWWVMCALEAGCVAPPRAYAAACDHVRRRSRADIRGQRPILPHLRTEDRHAQGCHRFDESALNILALNVVTSPNEYTSKYDILLGSDAPGQASIVERYKIQKCILE